MVVSALLENGNQFRFNNIVDGSSANIYANQGLDLLQSDLIVVVESIDPLFSVH